MALKNSTRNERVRLWVDYEASMAMSGCLKRFHKNKSFISNLEEIFNYLCKKLETLYNYRKSLHFFISNLDPNVHLLQTLQKKPHYIALSLSKQEYAIVKEYSTAQSSESSSPLILQLNPPSLNRLLNGFNIEHNSESHDGVLIPFNHDKLNMGFFVLWEEDNPDRNSKSQYKEILPSWISYYYNFLSEFLNREYFLLPEAYLPSCYSTRWEKVAILFADIRNFTPLTEVLRSVHTKLGNQETTILSEIMDLYFREMANIIQENGRGRIDKFMGDGIMAIFGEHESNPSKAVCRAVYAATEMVRRFRQLRPIFMEKAFGGSYETEYNESVEIELGIGINYGTALFEYLGDSRHKEFSVVGDHVNFAQRLELEAARYDEAKNTIRPPILISPTAERCIQPWLQNKEEIVLHPKGKGRLYRVYGIVPDYFRNELYDMCEKQNDWTTPWRRHQCEPPSL